MGKFRLKITVICVLLAVALAVPSVSFAADYDDKKADERSEEGKDWIDDPPAPPQELQGYKTAEKEITLRWRGLLGVSGYEIYLKKGSGTYHKVKEVKSKPNGRFTVKELSSKGIYKLRMRAYKMIMGSRKYSRYRMVTVDMRKQPLPKDLSLTKTLSLKTGQKKKIIITCTKGTESKYMKKISYKIKDKNIAKVTPQGVVVAKKPGKTAVIVKVKLKSGLTRAFTMELNVRK